MKTTHPVIPREERPGRDETRDPAQNAREALEIFRLLRRQVLLDPGSAAPQDVRLAVQDDDVKAF